MFVPRTALTRSTRQVARIRRFPNGGVRQPYRAQSTTSSASSTTASSSSIPPGLAGGIAGGLTTFLLGYGYYHFSGTKAIVQSVRSVKDKVESYPQKLKEQVPEPNQALQWLRGTVQGYAGFIPGAKQYVDGAFDDLDAIHQKHGKEVDEIVGNMYTEMKDLFADKRTKLDLDTAQRAGDILRTHLTKIYELAADSAQEILKNHPTLQQAVGEDVDQLKSLADRYGPEAKKELDKTWQQINDIVKEGLTSDTPNKVRKIVQEKTQKIKELGDAAWQKGMERAKPYLDKNPKVKQLIDENATKLKQSSFADLFQQIKQAVESGDTSSLEKFVKSAATGQGSGSGEGGSSGGGSMLEHFLGMIPGGAGGQVMSQLKQFQKIAQEHGDEAEGILKDTMEDLKGVLEKRMGQMKDVADKAKEKSKGNNTS